MNENFSLIISSFTDCSLSFNTAILQTCNDWRNYSTHAHSFYILLFWTIVLSSVLANIFKVKFYWYKKIFDSENKIINLFKLNEIVIDFDLFHYVRKLSISVLLVRIFQIYYVSKIYLGGV